MSLTRLSIIQQEPNDELTPVCQLNLTLRSPLTDTICDFIICADVNITDSRTQVNYHSGVLVKEVVDIFLAPSLQILYQL
jgi:hypothetical protein